MKKIFRFIIILQLTILFISNCNVLNNNVKNGYVIIGAKFPEKSFSIKKIPDTTNIIKLEVNSKDLPNGLFFELTKDKPSIKFQAPEGDTIATANAYDINNKLLAFGFASFYVKPYINNKVEIEMIEVEGQNGNQSSPTPTPTPSTNPNPNVTPTPFNNGGDSNGTTSPIPQSSSSVLISPSSTPSPTTSPETNGNGGVNTSPQQKANVNINVITSTPIPSGITVQ